MRKTTESKPKKKGLLALLKESIAKTSSGCGPGCGCHAEEQKKAQGSQAAKDDAKK